MEMRDLGGPECCDAVEDVGNPMSRSVEIAPEACTGGPGDVPISGAVSTLQEWFVRNSIPRRMGGAEQQSEETQRAVLCKKGGYNVVTFEENGKRFETRMMASWQQVWNATAMCNLTSLGDDMPLLYLVLYFCFHRYTIRVMCCIAVYVTIVAVTSALVWQTSYDLTISLIPPVLVFLCLPTMVRVTKGSMAVKTIRFDRSQLSLFSSRRKEDYDQEADTVAGNRFEEVPSLMSTLVLIFQLIKRYVGDACISGRRINNTAKMDYLWERKFRKAGTIGIESYIELAENVSGYLKTVYSVDTENKQGRAFVPRVYATYFTIFSVLMSTTWAIFFVGYRWYLYINYCDVFKVYDVSTDDSMDEGEARWCNNMCFEMIFTLGDIVSGINQALCTMAFLSSLALFMYGIDLTISLMNYFVLRYQSLRHFLPSNVNLFGCNATTESVVSYMRRDAFERYLYIKHFVAESSRLWSNFLVCTWGVSGLIIGVTYFSIITNYSKTGIVDISAVVYFFVSVAIAFLLLVLLSMTNTAVDIILNSFIYSGLDDYKLIGGRDEWVAYIGGAPLHWAVMGFVITPAWLSAFATTVLSGVASVFILPMFS